MTPRYDVLGLGVCAVDDILYVRAYPPPDGKAEVLARERHGGGLCATALVAAARLGARCAFAGTLGPDEESRFVLATFRREGIDTRHAARRAQAGPVRSVIVVDPRRGTRNIFFDTRRARGADPRRPAAAVVRAARVLLVDRFGMAGMIRAARLARRAGVPVVADFESARAPRIRELLALADHLVLSASFAMALTGARSPALAARRLWRAGRAAVVLTAGAQGCWFLDKARRPVGHLPAFRVRAVDTTGCGDVFHGAYAAALARGLPVEERLRFASAAAALKAQRHGGQAGAPTLAEVRRFLRRRS
jgi:sugar/nucleoside kinase (ribokinase family)